MCSYNRFINVDGVSVLAAHRLVFGKVSVRCPLAKQIRQSYFLSFLHSSFQSYLALGVVCAVRIESLTNTDFYSSQFSEGKQMLRILWTHR
jgi:hypothetical protein